MYYGGDDDGEGAAAAAEDNDDDDDVVGQYYGLVMMHNPSSPTTESGTGSEFQRKSTVVRVGQLNLNSYSTCRPTLKSKNIYTRLI